MKSVSRAKPKKWSSKCALCITVRNPVHVQNGMARSKLPLTGFSEWSIYMYNVVTVIYAIDDWQANKGELSCLWYTYKCGTGSYNPWDLRSEIRHLPKEKVPTCLRYQTFNHPASWCRRKMYSVYMVNVYCGNTEQLKHLRYWIGNNTRVEKKWLWLYELNTRRNPSN